jgi:formate dehydrogenase subunit delta
MHIESLVKMANQIGTFFQAMPDRDEALEGIAQHLAKFWEPRMRRELLSQLDSGAPLGLDDIVQTAIARHRSALG